MPKIEYPFQVATVISPEGVDTPVITIPISLINAEVNALTALIDVLEVYQVSDILITGLSGMRNTWQAIHESATPSKNGAEAATRVSDRLKQLDPNFALFSLAAALNEGRKN